MLSSVWPCVQKLEAKLEAAQAKLQRSNLICPTDLLPAVCIDDTLLADSGLHADSAPSAAPLQSLAALMRVSNTKSLPTLTGQQDYAPDKAPALGQAGRNSEVGCNASDTRCSSHAISDDEDDLRSSTSGQLGNTHCRPASEAQPLDQAACCTCTVVRTRSDPLFRGNIAHNLSAVPFSPELAVHPAYLCAPEHQHANAVRNVSVIEQLFALSASAAGSPGTICDPGLPRGQRLPLAPNFAVYHLAAHATALRVAPMQTSSTCAANAAAAAWNALCVPSSGQLAQLGAACVDAPKGAPSGSQVQACNQACEQISTCGQGDIMGHAHGLATFLGQASGIPAQLSDSSRLRNQRAAGSVSPWPLLRSTFCTNMLKPIVHRCARTTSVSLS